MKSSSAKSECIRNEYTTPPRTECKTSCQVIKDNQRECVNSLMFFSVRHQVNASSFTT